MLVAGIEFRLASMVVKWFFIKRVSVVTWVEVDLLARVLLPFASFTVVRSVPLAVSVLMSIAVTVPVPMSLPMSVPMSLSLSMPMPMTMSMSRSVAVAMMVAGSAEVIALLLAANNFIL